MQKQTKSFYDFVCFIFNNSAFSRTFANFLNRTYRTFRVSCRTYRTTVCHKLMAHSKLIIGWYNLFQVHFDFVGSSFVVRPIRFAIRLQCVSTTTAGLPNISPSTRFAVFLPVPARLVKSSIVSGTSPP